MPELVWETEPAPTAPPSGGSLATSAQPLLTYRDTLLAKAPRWLQKGLGAKVLYAIGVHMDGFGDAITAAVKLRFPGGYNNEALPYIGRDRRIRRGRAETDDVYVTRLLRWLDDHATRGGPYAMLAQLFAHYAPLSFEIHLVYKNGRRFQMGVSGTVLRDDLFVGGSTDWAKWRLYYFTDLGTFDGLWSDPGTWSDGMVWESDLTPEEVTDLRLIPREWNAAHCFGEIVLISGAVELWDYPVGVWSDPGVWGAIEDQPVTLSVE